MMIIMPRRRFLFGLGATLAVVKAHNIMPVSAKQLIVPPPLFKADAEMWCEALHKGVPVLRSKATMDVEEFAQGVFVSALSDKTAAYDHIRVGRGDDLLYFKRLGYDRYLRQGEVVRIKVEL